MSMSMVRLNNIISFFPFFSMLNLYNCLLGMFGTCSSSFTQDRLIILSLKVSILAEKRSFIYKSWIINFNLEKEFLRVEEFTGVRY